MPSGWKLFRFGGPRLQVVQFVRTFDTAFRNSWSSLRITFPLYLNDNIHGWMCRTSILKFLSKAVIYSSTLSIIEGTVLYDWFLRAITVERTRINVSILQQNAAHDVLTPIALCLVSPAKRTSRSSCRTSLAFYWNAGQLRRGRVNLTLLFMCLCSIWRTF
jgi:hypothetical protein